MTTKPTPPTRGGFDLRVAVEVTRVAGVFDDTDYGLLKTIAAEARKHIAEALGQGLIGHNVTRDAAFLATEMRMAVLEAAFALLVDEIGYGRDSYWEPTLGGWKGPQVQTVGHRVWHELADAWPLEAARFRDRPEFATRPKTRTKKGRLA